MYFSILPKKIGIHTIKAGDVEVGYLTDDRKIY
jgi:hypothetical protein